ncbi:MAG: TIGR02281 family clan AA aspartic protease [Pseudomonadota bacterium]
MDINDTMSLIYLVLLGTAIVGWFIAQNRQSLGKVMQSALVWAFIFLGAIAGFGLWEDIRQTVQPTQSIVDADGTIEVPRSGDGHYYLRLDVNGMPVTFVVDTGASNVVLTQGDAERIGIATEDLAFIGRAQTANGTVRTAPVRLDTVSLGQFTDRNLPASVNEGQMSQSLLGMTYLNRWSRIEITNGALVLTR